ncbi:MAG: hypothetical protein NVS9B10_13730 [Nevskia sp.]
MRLSVSELTELSALEAIADEWQALAAQLDPLTPFAAPLWNLLWWKHFRADRPLLRDALRVFVMRDEAARLVAVAPMILTQRPGVGPLRVRQLHFLGADPNITELRGMSCRPEHEPRAVAALTEHLQAAAAGDWHWLQWSGLRSDLDAILAAQPVPAALSYTDPIPSYVLALPDSWDAFRGGLSRNIKESLRKCYNSLKRDGHAFRFRCVSDPGSADAAIRRFLELHTARAGAGLAVHHSNVFSTPQSRAFLAGYAQAMATRGQLQVFQIEIAGAVVATRIGFTFGRTLYLYYSGYDPAWGRYSIMTTVLAEAIKWAIANGYTSVNLSTGNDVSKTRWSPVEIRFHNAVLKRRHWRARLAYGAYAALRGEADGNGLAAGIASRLGSRRV